MATNQIIGFLGHLRPPRSALPALLFLPFTILTRIFTTYRTRYLNPVAGYLAGRLACVVAESWQRGVAVVLALGAVVRGWQRGKKGGGGPTLGMVTVFVYWCVVAGVVVEDAARREGQGRRKRGVVEVMEEVAKGGMAQVYVVALLLVEAGLYWRASGRSAPYWVRGLPLDVYRNVAGALSSQAFSARVVGKVRVITYALIRVVVVAASIWLVVIGDAVRRDGKASAGTTSR